MRRPFSSIIICVAFLHCRSRGLSRGLLSSFAADAYLIRPHPRVRISIADRTTRKFSVSSSCNLKIDSSRGSSSVLFNSQDSVVKLQGVPRTAKLQQLKHADITWRLSLPPDTPSLQKMQWKISGKLLKLQCQIQGVDPPRLIFPLGGQAVLEAYDRKTKSKLGRFGIVTEAGPSTPELEQTVQEIYNNGNPVAAVRAGAIIYMFVEPAFRGRGLGCLALETIAFLHAARGCSYTILVADDKSPQQQTLVRWYERHGYTRAPYLQNLLGSPDGVYGVTMIAPTATSVPEDCLVKWW